MSKGLEFFRKMLEEERDRLRAELEAARRKEPLGNIGYSNHMAETATEAFEQTKGQSLERRLERLLADVEYALSKFEKGTYGICENCGKPIDPARLEALPYAVLCFECQHRYEFVPQKGIGNI
ncbi:MAG: molecular chaperone DnaK [Chloroflexi bacterium]|nr:MAG: molecular chaperone DnaK [Chloroflexota bacterium]HDN78952.1 molecular chaperone DnaK [Chloroflexota bacterium]